MNPSSVLLPHIPKELFAPHSNEVGKEDVLRPSLSYWEDAWVSLKKNRRALWSLYIILILLSSAFVLPLIVNLDPESQDLTQISQGPNLGQKSLIVETNPWEGRFADNVSRIQSKEVTGLKLVGEAHTESVRFTWEPANDVERYAIYRHILNPSGPKDLGLPLGVTEYSGQIYYEDRLKLKTQTYYYSVVALGSDDSYLHYSTLKVVPRHATSLTDALQRGLIQSDGAVQTKDFLGKEIDLPKHLLGTDQLGRDMAARLIYGGQTSLYIGIIAPLLFVAIGIVYGGISGYMGGRVDEVMMRFADFVIALPFLLFMILFRVAMGIESGESGVTPMLVALVALGWPSVARLVRGQVLQLREQPFVEAARLLGASPGYLILKHMLPNVMGVVLVSLTFAIPSAIFTEAFLSFIGMGVAPPTPSWGAMCNDGIKTFLSHPHELLFPALLISITVLAFNLLGDGLRDALDARIKE